MVITIMQTPKIQNLVSIGTYGVYSSSNYGMNTLWVRINDLTLFYSYQTVVAYIDHSTDGNMVCSENIWSKTTGKHLNWLEPNKNARLPYSEFIDKVNKLVDNNNIQKVEIH